ncbi:MAG: CBS domain-containing protein [Desulfuromonadales bacterium]|nr:CBS domain-containing protein [Desulfuromonadales bacterium]
MPEEATFFLPVRDYCHRHLITCSVHDSVMTAAQVMRERKISSLIACDENGQPVGIMTDRDLRSKVVADGLEPRSLKVSAIMTSPVISVREDDTLFEVLYRMSRHRIHRIGVVDENNALVGFINESDIIRLQNRSPQHLLKSIDEAGGTEDLRKINAESEQLIVFLSRNGVGTTNLVQLIALINDQLTDRLIQLLKHKRFYEIEKNSTFMVLGSEGRREQTLKTDQDNAIIYADDVTDQQLAEIKAFSEALIESLIDIGVPECPGGIMARNDFWRRSLNDWKRVVNDWIDRPKSENILNFGMLSDMRGLCGDRRLERELRHFILEKAQNNSIFMARMAQNVVNFSQPLGWFGRVKVERKGEHAGEIDLKKAGIFTITEGVKTLALSVGIFGGSTLEKLTQLKIRGVLDKGQAADVEAAFSLLTGMRLRIQIEAAAAGKDITNFVAPATLDRVEMGRLKQALEVVMVFIATLKQHFRLDMMRN